MEETLGFLFEKKYLQQKTRNHKKVLAIRVINFIFSILELFLWKAGSTVEKSNEFK